MELPGAGSPSPHLPSPKLPVPHRNRAKLGAMAQDYGAERNPACVKLHDYGAERLRWVIGPCDYGAERVASGVIGTITVRNEDGVFLGRAITVRNVAAARVRSSSIAAWRTVSHRSL